MCDPAPIISDSLTSPDFNFPVTSDTVKETVSVCNKTSIIPSTPDTPVTMGLVNNTNNAAPTSIKVCRAPSSFVKTHVKESHADIHVSTDVCSASPLQSLPAPASTQKLTAAVFSLLLTVTAATGQIPSSQLHPSLVAGGHFGHPHATAHDHMTITRQHLPWSAS